MKYKNINFDLKQLWAFHEVCREGSFTRASRALRTGQSTISHQIAILEKTLGVSLILRSSKEFSLTREGMIFKDYCHAIFSSTEEMLSAITQDSYRGSASIAASTIPAAYLVPRVIAALEKAYPGFRYTVITGDSKETAERLKDGTCQVGVLGYQIRHRSLSYKKIASDSIILIGPASSSDTMKLYGLRKAPLIVREKGSGTRNAIEQYLSTLNIRFSELNLVLECSSTESLKESVIAGIGFGFISNLAVDREIKLGLLKKIIIQGPAIKRDFFLVHRSKQKQTKAVDLFIKEMENQYL